MGPDPHEAGARLPEYSKHPEDEAVLAAVNDALARAQIPRRSKPRVDPRQLPIVYVVGAPRSGTTLLSQLCSRHMPVGYVDNLVARFWRRPSVGIMLSQALLGADRMEQIALESKHGLTPEPWGPHEFGYFWRQWLPVDTAPTHHVEEAALRSVDVVGLRRMLEEEMLAEFGKPMVLKNLVCGFHARLLQRVHERSLFVHVRRGLRDTCASVLRARLERYGDVNVWWSLRPASLRRLPSDPVEQVVRQVVECRQEIDDELRRLPRGVIEVDYAHLCGSPGEVLERLLDRVRSLGMCVGELRGTPPSLRARPAPVLPEEVAARLEEILVSGSEESELKLR